MAPIRRQRTLQGAPQNDSDDEYEQSSQRPTKKQKTFDYQNFQWKDIATIKPKNFVPKPSRKKISARPPRHERQITPPPKKEVDPDSSDEERRFGPVKVKTKAEAESEHLLSVWSTNVDISGQTQYIYENYLQDMPPAALRKRKVPVPREDGMELDENAAPFSTISDIYADMARKAGPEFLKACESFFKQGLRVVTMCSGTESPILAMQLLKEAFGEDGSKFRINHLASAEIEPFKQAYIQRNFSPPLIFRDVCEFDEAGQNKPHTVNGGIANPPEDVHMLIAGSSCIDYSSLNNAKNRKDFDYQGQSRSTLDGVLNFAKNARPAVIILENVALAPWAKIQAKLHDIGYFAMVFKVDSKNHYLPQTRLRGYCVAFERDRAEEIDLNFEKVIHRVEKYLSTFAQRASAPYTDFIHNDDDVELQMVQRRLNTSKEGRNDRFDWVASRHRHATFRSVNELGFTRPLTRWREDGSCQFPDHAWHQWTKSQVERIWDLLDIRYLSFAAKRAYDLTFKHRWIDVSQNVDRDADNRQFGLVGCVTPSGIPYDTRRGGPVFGREVLALQGIPAEKLLLNKETSRQLQDLAGNAMTSTVVGAFVFSAILAATQPRVLNSANTMTGNDSMFKTFPKQPFLESEVQALKYATIQDLQKNSGLCEPQNIKHNFQQQPESLRYFSEVASKTLQLCRCEGLFDSFNDYIYACRDCGHTCCKKCKGNPTHNYDHFCPKLVVDRIDPEEFFKLVTAALPPSLQIQGLAWNASILSAQLGENLFGHETQYHPLVRPFGEYVANVLVSSFHFRVVKREKMWRVLYESEIGSLELRITPRPFRGLPNSTFTHTNSVEIIWLLYAKPPRTEKVRSIIRKVFTQPIARMTPTTSLLDRIWELRCQVKDAIELKITSAKKLVPAWEQNIGLQAEHFVVKEVPQQMEIQISKARGEDVFRSLICIEGTYQLYQQCGGASGSLHSKISDPECMFLFLDPVPVGEAFSDKFVFARHHDRLPDNVPRQIMAGLPPKWRPRGTKTKTVICPLIDIWKPCESLIMRPNLFECIFKVFAPISESKITIDGECSKIATSIIVPMPPTTSITGSWEDQKVTIVDLINQPSALLEFQWILKSAVQINILDKWMTINFTESHFTNCSCLPKLPTMEWHVASKPKSKSIIIAPFENPSDVERYEAEIKNRSLPITAEFHCGHTSHLIIKFNLNTLAHRVLSKLSAVYSPFSTSIHWRLAEDRNLQDMTRFPPAELEKYPSDEMMMQKRIRNFSRGKAYALWNNQLQTLAWMQMQELAIKNWSIYEREEVQLPALNLRLDMQGKKGVTVRGGVVADRVGAGKTITSLALAAESIDRQPDSLGQGVINSGATLILVPENIILQWQEEMITFLDSEVRTLVIANMTDFKNLSWKDMLDKDIILAPWHIFLSQVYWKQMRTVCYAPNVPQQAGRCFDQWLSEAVADLGGFLRKISSAVNSDTFTQDFWAARDANIANANQKYGRMFKAFRQETSAQGNTSSAQNDDPAEAGIAGAKRMSQKVNKYMQHGHAQMLDDEEIELDDDYEKMREEKARLLPLFHMFKFKRLIVDEFSYLRGQALQAITKLQADCRWMLSGTPPITDYDSINMTAKLLGTFIASVDEKNGVLGFAKGTQRLIKDKSSAEECRSYTETESTEKRWQRHTKAIKFVKTFMKQNTAQLAKNVKRSDVHKYTEMTVIESCIYNRTAQYLLGASVRFELKKLTFAAAKKSTNWEEKVAYALRYYKKSPMVSLLTCCPAVLEVCFADETSDEEQMETPDQRVLARFIDEKRMEFCEYVDEIQELLRKAFISHAATRPSTRVADIDNEHLDGFFQQLLNHAHGDSAVSALLCTILRYIRNGELDSSAEEEDASDHEDEDEGRSFKSPAERLKLLGIDLAQTTRDIIQIVRELRHYEVLDDILSCKSSQWLCSYCFHMCPLETVEILSNCGHVVCTDCMDDPIRRRDNPDGCPQPGCNATGLELRRVASHYRGNTVGGDLARFGGKMSAVVGQVKAILNKEEEEEDEEEDKVLVFTQHAAQAEELVKALGAEGIEVVDATARAGAGVKRFLAPPKAKSTAPACRVLLLKIDSEDAAGWNLQLCNHVIFLSPYLATTRYDYKSTMEQAVGRCLRHGQTKDVFVYHFMVDGTVEVAMAQQLR